MTSRDTATDNFCMPSRDLFSDAARPKRGSDLDLYATTTYVRPKWRTIAQNSGVGTPLKRMRFPDPCRVLGATVHPVSPLFLETLDDVERDTPWPGYGLSQQVGTQHRTGATRSSHGTMPHTAAFRSTLGSERDIDNLSKQLRKPRASVVALDGCGRFPVGAGWQTAGGGVRSPSLVRPFAQASVHIIADDDNAMPERATSTRLPGRAERFAPPAALLPPGIARSSPLPGGGRPVVRTTEDDHRFPGRRSSSNKREIAGAAGIQYPGMDNPPGAGVEASSSVKMGLRTAEERPSVLSWNAASSSCGGAVGSFGPDERRVAAPTASLRSAGPGAFSLAHVRCSRVAPDGPNPPESTPVGEDDSVAGIVCGPAAIVDRDARSASQIRAEATARRLSSGAAAASASARGSGTASPGVGSPPLKSGGRRFREEDEHLSVLERMRILCVTGNQTPRLVVLKSEDTACWSLAMHTLSG